MKLDLV